MGSSTREDEVSLLPRDLQFVADKFPFSPGPTNVARTFVHSLLVKKLPSSPPTNCPLRRTTLEYKETLAMLNSTELTSRLIY